MVTSNRTKDTEGSETEDYHIRFEDLEYSQHEEPGSSTMVTSEPIEQRVSVGHKNHVHDSKKMYCMIRLEDELFGLWRSQIEERLYPAAGESIRTLRMCCYEADIDANVRALRGNKALLKALCIELKLQSARVHSKESNRYKWANAEVCINILEIIYEIVKSPSNDEYLIKNNIMLLAANCAYLFSGYMTMPEVIVPRTTGIVLAALRILDVLTTRQIRNLPAKKFKPILVCLKLHPTVKSRDVDGCSTLLSKIENKLSTQGQEL